MRILALNWRDWSNPRAGGAEVHLREILTRLVARGDEATLVTASFPGGAAESLLDGVRVLRVGADWNAAWTVPPAARRLLREEAFDVVLDDVNKVPFAAPRWSPVPVVALFHHLFGRHFFAQTDPLRAAILLAYERRIGSWYRGVPGIVYSGSTRAELVAAGLRDADLRDVALGLDHGVFRPDETARATEPRALLVTRLMAYKRADVAVRAAARIARDVPGFRLEIVGDGPERTRLEQLVRQLSAPVDFAGFVSEEEKVRRYRRARVVLAPSAKEGFGLTVIEALACGTPVVASDVAGHRDALPADAGFRVPAGADEAMADAATLLLRDDALHAACAARGLVWAQRFDWERCAEGVRATLAAAVKERAARG